MTKYKTLFLLLVLFCFCGCIRHEAGTQIKPSAVPEKTLTKTAIPGDISQAVLNAENENAPWKYCQAVGTNGPVIHKVSELPSEELTRRVQITFMIQDNEKDSSYVAQRCMNGEIYVCRVSEGTNCIEKLDYSLEANEAMLAFCADPDRDGTTVASQFSGRNSAYEWRCLDGVPVIVSKIAEADPEGYDQSLWFTIPEP